MHRFTKFLVATCLVAGGIGTAQAEEAPAEPFTISGSATLVSQYRWRGISLSDEELAVQAGIDLAHESGFYISTWASSLAGFGSFGGANTEVDIIGGYSTSLGNVALDGGAVWYLYPGTSDFDYVEVYASVSGDLGPVSTTLGAYYAPDQNAIGGDDNIYVYLDGGFAVPNTPLSFKAHVGYTDGAFGGPDGNYLNWLVGVDLAWRNLTFGVAYVDTDIGKAGANAFYAGFGGHDIVDEAILFSVSAAF